METTQMLINGDLVAGDLPLDVVNPATGKAFLTVSRASERQLEAALVAAKTAQKSWARTSFAERSLSVVRFADALRNNAEAMATLLVKEQGKPIAQARIELAAAESFVRYFATQEFASHALQDSDEFRSSLHYRPLGVIAAITPWNFPVLIAAFKIAPALMMGNTVVLKPAQTTPATSLAVGALARDIFPAGVLNVVADNGDLGALLSRHPSVDKISFTGSTATGRKVMATAADAIKRVTLELGGNDAAILLEDCDIDAVADRLLDGAWANAGQICTAIKRIYAPRHMYASLCDTLVDRAKARQVGNGLEEGVRVGPLQNGEQFRKARDYMDVANRDGEVISGGWMGNEGNFVAPTLVRGVPASSRLVREEQFCPILPLLAYDDLDAAIEDANSTEYGLGGSIWTKDLDRAARLAPSLHSGTVWVNTHDQVSPQIPMGGAKQSGLGVEFSRYGMEEFAQKTVVRIRLPN